MPTQVPTRVVVWPRVASVTAITLSAVLVGATLLGWWALPESVQIQFTIGQVLTLIGIVIVMIGLMLGLGLSRVRADESGLMIRNGVRVHRYRWDEIRGVRFRPGDPWAYVLLDTTPERRERSGEKYRRQQMIAVQSPDGARARKAVDDIVALGRYYSGDSSDSD